MRSKNYFFAHKVSDNFGEGPDDARDISFDYLMELHDEDFVQAAYELLLKRKADITGIRYYTQRLRRGYSRASVLKQLVDSSEIRTDWRKIEGLAEEIDRYRRSRTLWGWRSTLNDLELGRTLAQRQARILQNNLGAQRRLLSHATREIHRDVTELLNQAQTPENERAIDDRSAHRFQPPRPRSISEIREADLPDHIRTFVRQLDF